MQFLGSFSVSTFVITALKIGVIGVIQKPFIPEKLIETIKKVMGET
jgi:DNA-binding NarL/FixJ family response regulator